MAWAAVLLTAPVWAQQAERVGDAHRRPWSAGSASGAWTLHSLAHLQHAVSYYRWLLACLLLQESFLVENPRAEFGDLYSRWNEREIVRARLLEFRDKIERNPDIVDARYLLASFRGIVKTSEGAGPAAALLEVLDHTIGETPNVATRVELEARCRDASDLEIRAVAETDFATRVMAMLRRHVEDRPGRSVGIAALLHGRLDSFAVPPKPKPAPTRLRAAPPPARIVYSDFDHHVISRCFEDLVHLVDVGKRRATTFPRGLTPSPTLFWIDETAPIQNMFLRIWALRPQEGELEEQSWHDLGRGIAAIELPWTRCLLTLDSRGRSADYFEFGDLRVYPVSAVRRDDATFTDVWVEQRIRSGWQRIE